MDLRDDNDWTALLIACYHSNTDSNIETVELLIEKGARLDLKKYSFSCIQFLVRESTWESFDLVQKYYIEIVNHKLCMQKILKDIRNKSNILYKADSMRSKLLAIKWRYNLSYQYHNLTNDQKEFLNKNFSIYDGDSFKIKLKDLLKWMN